ncbi:hypothetical protein H696_02999 [Fonticula alba]|uniref:Uncharacterized protein n=1 Tax=Fonticula alba TaxID=691883 RepID=A0A058Z8L9_FONAL|nr:hypothetical protein H696_02999 [Fonticula alba]KCV70644.1 hypothetical protein H696_02999 [Fonticula alba]|eukprot:XP_009495160.1 hypothetical protein H696_02999 [Fonticula alba]
MQRRPVAPSFGAGHPSPQMNFSRSQFEAMAPGTATVAAPAARVSNHARLAAEASSTRKFLLFCLLLVQVLVLVLSGTIFASTCSPQWLAFLFASLANLYICLELSRRFLLRPWVCVFLFLLSAAFAAVFLLAFPVGNVGCLFPGFFVSSSLGSLHHHHQCGNAQGGFPGSGFLSQVQHLAGRRSGSRCGVTPMPPASSSGYRNAPNHGGSHLSVSGSGGPTSPPTSGTGGQSLSVSGPAGPGIPSRSDRAPASPTGGEHHHLAAPHNPVMVEVFGDELSEGMAPAGASASNSLLLDSSLLHSQSQLFPGVYRLHHVALPRARFKAVNNHQRPISKFPFSPGRQVIPLYLDGVAPWTLTFRVEPLPPGVFDLAQFTLYPRTLTEKTITISEAENYFLDAPTTGLYTLLSVTDQRGLKGIVGDETVQVVVPPVTLPGLPPRPPSAAFLRDEPLETCIGNSISVFLRLTGEAPFTVSLERAHNNAGPSTRQTVRLGADDALQGEELGSLVDDAPEEAAPALLAGAGAAGPDGVPTVVLPPANSPQLDRFYFRLPLGPLENDGRSVWRVVSVADARNMTSVYIADEFSSVPSSVRASVPPPTVSALAYSRPTVQLADSLQPEKPIIISRTTPTRIPLQLEARYPVAVDIQFPDGELKRHMFEKPPAAGHLHTFVLSEPGEYKIASVADALCFGNVQYPATLTVELAPEPTLRLAGLPDPAAARCHQGNSLLTATLHLTGHGPWQVEFRDRVQSDAGGTVYDTGVRRLAINSSPYQFRMPVDVAGRHEVVFLSISDSYYRGVPLQGLADASADAPVGGSTDSGPYSFSQVFREAGRAFFEDLPVGDQQQGALGTPAQPIHRCLGQGLTLPVRLEGSSPFALTYSLVSFDGRQREYRLEDLAGPSVDVRVEAFSHTGRYTIRLLSVTDAFGCTRELRQERVITVSHVTAAMTCEVVGGVGGTGGAGNTADEWSASAGVPAGGVVRAGRGSHLVVRFAGGTAPYTLTYRAPGRAEPVVVSGLRGSSYRIPLETSGLYELLGVRDNICQGVLASASPEGSTGKHPAIGGRPSACNILLVEPPALTVRQLTTSACVGQRIPLAELSFTGEAPWKLNYFFTSPNPSGQRGSSENSATLSGVSKTPFSFDIIPERAGFHQYRFADLSDTHYGNIPLSTKAIMLQAYDPPSVTFASTLVSDLFACVGDDLALPIVLHGVAPFKLHYAVTRLPDGADQLDESALMSSESSRPLPRRELSMEFGGSGAGAGRGTRISAGSASRGTVTASLDIAQALLDAGPMPFAPGSGSGSGSAAGLPATASNAAQRGRRDPDCPPQLQAVGAYRFSLIRVEDATGCQTELSPAPGVHVYIGPEPDLVVRGEPDSVDRCVGDRLRVDFALLSAGQRRVGSASAEERQAIAAQTAAAGPWHVAYAFDGDERTRHTRQSRLSLQVLHSGRVSFLAVGNRFCTRALDAGHPLREVTFHPLPRAVLNRGRESEVFVVAGQQEPIDLALSGTPPFNVSIRRSSFETDGYEFYDLAGIQGHSHVFVAESEGEYRVMRVADRYCMAERDGTSVRASSSRRGSATSSAATGAAAAAAAAGATPEAEAIAI